MYSGRNGPSWQAAQWYSALDQWLRFNGPRCWLSGVGCDNPSTSVYLEAKSRATALSNHPSGCRVKTDFEIGINAYYLQEEATRALRKRETRIRRAGGSFRQGPSSRGDLYPYLGVQ